MRKSTIVAVVVSLVIGLVVGAVGMHLHMLPTQCAPASADVSRG